jgi:type IV pilus assembly protein PilB
MTKRVITKRIGEVLIERKVITREHLDQALAHQRQNGGIIGQILIQLGFANEAEIALALTAQYGFPYLPLESYEIDKALMSIIPGSQARQYCLIPIDRIGNALTLAMADPTNVQAIEAVEQMTHCVVQTFVSTPSDIRQAIDKYYGAEGANPEAPPAASKETGT